MASLGKQFVSFLSDLAIPLQGIDPGERTFMFTVKPGHRSSVAGN